MPTKPKPDVITLHRYDKRKKKWLSSWGFVQGGDLGVQWLHRDGKYLYGLFAACQEGHFLIVRQCTSLSSLSQPVYYVGREDFATHIHADHADLPDGSVYYWPGCAPKEARDG